jgi:hypothetical protein
MEHSSAQSAPTTDALRSEKELIAFVQKWAPVHFRKQFIGDLGQLISAVGYDIVKGAKSPIGNRP